MAISWEDTSNKANQPCYLSLITNCHNSWHCVYTFLNLYQLSYRFVVVEVLQCYLLLYRSQEKTPLIRNPLDLDFVLILILTKLSTLIDSCPPNAAFFSYLPGSTPKCNGFLGPCPHPSTNFHGNPFSSVCVIRLLDKQTKTNKQHWKQVEVKIKANVQQMLISEQVALHYYHLHFCSTEHL